MAKPYSLLLFHILFALFFLRISPSTLPNITSEKGLSLPVLYSDFVNNQSLYANLTTFQRLERKIQSSVPHFQWIRSTYNTTMIRPPLFEHSKIFMVSVSIGSGRGMKAFTLELDTGNPITWTQCIPCSPSFPQSQPMFDPIISTSYHFLPSTSPICKPPFQRDKDKCFYNVQYRDQNQVSGFLSTETFTFQSSNHPSRFESIPNLIFGCTHMSHMNYVGEPAGNMGMNRGQLSFAMQLAARTNGHFSYCFFRPLAAVAGFLRFGNDIVMQGQVQRTPFKDVQNSEAYHLDLDDISIGNQRLYFPARTFDVTLIDSGTVASHLIQPAYAHVREILLYYFDHFHLVPFQRPGLPLDLCYNLPHDFTRFLPNMTLHLRGADLTIHGEELFLIDVQNNFFCLGMVPDDQMTILGVLQQYNTRFTYDLNSKEILFVHEDCKHDVANL